MLSDATLSERLVRVVAIREAAIATLCLELAAA